MFTLDEARLACAGHPEFIFHEYAGLVSCDYMIAATGSFAATAEEAERRAFALAAGAANARLGAGAPAAAAVVGRDEKDRFRAQAQADCARLAWLRRNCRGATFCAENGTLASLPWHKFFAVGQTAATSWEALRGRAATTYDKLDGCMVHAFRHPRTGRLAVSTRRSAETAQAQAAARLLATLPEVGRAAESLCDAGYTPLFEFLSPAHQVVVAHPVPRLVYLHSRRRDTGAYVWHGDLFADAVASHDLTPDDLPALLAGDGFEGFVCHMAGVPDAAPHRLVKFKTAWYAARHKAVKAMHRPACQLYELALTGVLEDVTALAPAHIRPHLEALQDEAAADLSAALAGLEAAFRDALGGAAARPPEARRADRDLRKRAALVLRGRPDFAALMQLYQGRDPAPALRELLVAAYRRRTLGPGGHPLRLGEVLGLDHAGSGRGGDAADAEEEA